MWLCPTFLLLSLPGCFPLLAPVAETGRERASLTVECRYKQRWQNYVKYWCRGPWKTCSTLVSTTASELEVKKDRVSIKDDQKRCVFTVTMEELRRDDADIYWCGIQKSGNDLWAKVTVNVVPEGVALDTVTNVLFQSSTAVSSGPQARTHYILLVFVKVPILLAVVGAILWLKGTRRTPEGQCEEPLYMNSSFNLLIQNTVPQEEG